MIARVGVRPIGSGQPVGKVILHFNSVSPIGAATIIALNTIPQKTAFGFEGKTIRFERGSERRHKSCRLRQVGNFWSDDLQ